VVNRELHALHAGLPDAVEMLRPGGRLAVISFHSLEDRAVKVFFKQQMKVGPYNILTKKPIVAEEAEQRENPRSRSAKLRVLEKM